MCKLHFALRFLFIVLLCNTLSKSSSAQFSFSKDVADKLYTGGNFGASFGTITYIDVSPLLGYRVTDNFSAGIGFTYTYLKDKTYIPAFSTSIYGGRVFGKYVVYEGFYAYSEIELLNLDFITKEGRTNIYNVYVGPGYQQPIGTNSSFGIMILYNLNQTASPYFYQPNPVIRVGFNIGL